MDERMKDELVKADGTAYDAEKGILIESWLSRPTDEAPELIAFRVDVKDLEHEMGENGPHALVSDVSATWPVEARIDASTPAGRAQAMAYLEGLSPHVAYGSELLTLISDIRDVRNDGRWQLDRALGKRDITVDADAIGDIVATLSRPDDFYSAEARLLVVSYAHEWNTPRDVEVWSGIDPEDLTRWVTSELRGKDPSEIGLADFSQRLFPSQCEAIVRIDDKGGMERLAAELTDPEEGFATGSEVVATVARSLRDVEREAVSRAVGRLLEGDVTHGRDEGNRGAGTREVAHDGIDLDDALRGTPSARPDAADGARGQALPAPKL